MGQQQPSLPHPAPVQPPILPGYVAAPPSPQAPMMGHGWPPALHPDHNFQLHQQSLLLQQHAQQPAQDYLGHFGYLAALHQQHGPPIPAGVPALTSWPPQPQLQPQDGTGMERDSPRSVLLTLCGAWGALKGDDAVEAD